MSSLKISQTKESSSHTQQVLKLSRKFLRRCFGKRKFKQNPTTDDISSLTNEARVVILTSETKFTILIADYTKFYNSTQPATRFQRNSRTTQPKNSTKSGKTQLINSTKLRNFQNGEGRNYKTNFSHGRIPKEICYQQHHTNLKITKNVFSSHENPTITCIFKIFFCVSDTGGGLPVVASYFSG